MSIRTIAIGFCTAFGLALGAASGPAFADNMVSGVVSEWNAETRQMTFDDETVFEIPADVMADAPEPGQTVTIEYSGGEDGVDKIKSVKIDE